MANRFPLVVDSSSSKIEEIPSGDNLNLSGNSIINVSDLTVTGNVGIGTTNPTSKLHVSGTGGNQIVISDAGSTGGSIKITNASTGATAADGFILGYDGSNNIEVRNYENTDVIFFTGNTEKVRINSSGNVGIGTTNPLAKLHVATGAASTQSFVVTSTGCVGIGTSIPKPDLVLDVDGSVGGISSFRTHVQMCDDIYISGGTDGIVGLYYQALPGVAGRTAAYQQAGAVSNCGIGTYHIIAAPGYLSGAGAVAVECFNNRVNIKGGMTLDTERPPAGAPYEIGDIASAGGNDGVFVITNTASGGNFNFAVRSAGGAFSYAISMNSSGVTVGGALSKSSGSFRIPHPVAEGKDLVHSFIEGPRADLIYRGTVTLSGGTATVNLDEEYGLTAGTWNALCRNPQVWVTSDTGWTLCKGSVPEGVLTIEAQTSTCTETVSWLVVAERKDVHMYDTEWTDENGRPILEPNTIVTEVNTAE